MIDIRYTPLEEGYQPPYYRATSAVTLTCRAVGASGRIRYRWTSTCSSCFVPGGYYYSYGSNSRTRPFLVSRDAGTHTCSAYDTSRGISGSTSTMMKVVGECLQWQKKCCESNQNSWYCMWRIYVPCSQNSALSL